MPATAEVTETLNVQVDPASMDAPEMLTDVPPGAALTVPAVQVVAAAGTGAITTFAGSVSINAIDESGSDPACVFAIVTVSVDVPLAAINAGAKLLASVTPETLPMFSTADAGAVFVAPCVDVTAPAGTVFV
jgi:hypothetical protein